MYRDHRIVAFIPYGRERTVSILSKYLLREAATGILDEVMLCMNTDPDQGGDITYARQLASREQLFNLYERPHPTINNDIPSAWAGLHQAKQQNTGRFYYYMQDPDTIYVRFDDDIVWVHPNAITALCDHLLDRAPASPFVVFPFIWNNAICSWWAQQQGWLRTDEGRAGRFCMDPVGWRDPQFGIHLHNTLLDKLENGGEKDLPHDKELVLNVAEQFSVSCFAIKGSEFVDVGGVIDTDVATSRDESAWEEEHWLTGVRPRLVRRPNVVYAGAHVSHLTFFTQREHILRTDIPERYRRLADKIAC